ncbi:MAG: NUDIX hydrolase [Terriglobales bacterium]
MGVVDAVKRHAFWMLSRTGLAVYSRLPIFGPLRVSVGVFRKQDSFLVIERSDGRGLSFPGGIAMPWEGTEQAMKREFSEETGLLVTSSRLKDNYFSNQEIPVNLAVFEVEAEGQLRASWEGTPCWLPLSALRQRLLPSQRRIVDAFCQS